jgi:hypothetical protein
MFLSRDEIKALTGYVRASAQIRWLTRHGYLFAVNALGHPVVALAEANRKLVGDFKIRSEPNWAAINAPMERPREPQLRFDGVTAKRRKRRP